MHLIRISVCFIALLVLSGYKVDAQNFHWAKIIGGKGSDVFGTIQMDSAKNLYMVGEFQDTCDFDPGPGTFTIASSVIKNYSETVILKLDSNGNFIWAKSIRGLPTMFNYNSLIPASFQLQKDGSLLLAGTIYGDFDFDPGPGTFSLSAPSGTSFPFIAKYTLAGQFIWAKIIGSTSGYIFSLVSDSAENHYVSGAYHSQSVFFAKYDSDLNLKWINCCNPYCGGYLALSRDGSIWGASESLFQYSPQGALLWSGNLSNASINQISHDNKDNLILAGYFTSSANLDPGPDSFFVQSKGHQDAFIMKYSKSGGIKWANIIGSITQEQPSALSVDEIDNVYVGGIFQDSTRMIAGQDTININGTGAWDSFIMKFDSTGKPLMVKSLQGADDMSGCAIYSIITDKPGNIFISGMFQRTVDINPDLTISTQAAKGLRDGYIMKLGECISTMESGPDIYLCAGECGHVNVSGAYSYSWTPGWGTVAEIVVCPTVTTTYIVSGTMAPGCYNTASVVAYVDECTSVQESEASTPFTIFPNPSSGTFSVAGIESGDVCILDALGRTVCQFKLMPQSENTFKAARLTEGVYYIRAGNNVQKLIVRP